MTARQVRKSALNKNYTTIINSLPVFCGTGMRADKKKEKHGRITGFAKNQNNTGTFAANTIIFTPKAVFLNCLFFDLQN